MNNTNEDNSQDSDFEPEVSEADVESEQGLSSENDVNKSDASIVKISRLLKVNLLLTVIGIGALGYWQFHNHSNTEKSIAKSKVSLKQEIAEQIDLSLASYEPPQIQPVVDKNAELEMKVIGYEAQISDLQTKLSQFQVELEKNENLRSKLSELEFMVKRMKAPVKANTYQPKVNKTKPKTPVKKVRR